MLSFLISKAFQQWAGPLGLLLIIFAVFLVRTTESVHWADACANGGMFLAFASFVAGKIKPRLE